ncbi:Protein CBG03810 [Caenorhabditis briggsae]|uniref:Uncharacterized protein n=2 Tax=Caenorhabditis briggsae TaxID=6238 RepID=A0AAE9IYX2_CAEBR|nr:Protein CBG03810 [Caenorhabditis briggsae]ULU10866.1 hypothetical protein L3Y34_014833 [Caenorhabditis briggsae]CAP24638.1 Protein CBG03810 [Caenorhabditis briggsae]
MEDFLQLIVKCFPMATFILIAASCTSKPKEQVVSRGRKLTMSTSSMTSELEDDDRKEEVEEEKVVIPMEMNEEENRKVACGNKKDSKDKPEKPGEDSPDKKDNNKKEELKAEQEIILDETNPHFAYLLAGENREPKDCVFHSRGALEQTAAFQWTMKKRLSFDEGCWKQLSRRISAIKAEGFEVRVNTRQAKENRNNADRETKLDAVFAKWAAVKPKKKGAE